MGNQYKYEAPGVSKQLFLFLTDRLLGRKTPVEWVLDKQTGQRFPIDETESALLTVLGDHLSYFDALPNSERVKLTDQTFDAIASAFSSRRAGDTSKYEELLRWETADWRNWCDDQLARLSSTKDVHPG